MYDKMLDATRNKENENTQVLFDTCLVKRKISVTVSTRRGDGNKRGLTCVAGGSLNPCFLQPAT